MCKSCNLHCTAEKRVQCYICNIEAHYPCSKFLTPKALTLDSDEQFKLLNGGMKYFKWFCNTCNHISFPEAAKLIGEKVLKKEKKNTNKNMSKELNKNASANENTQHFPSFQKQLCEQFKSIVTNEIKSIREDISGLIKPFIPTCSAGEPLAENKITRQTYADMSSTNSENQSTATSNSIPKSRNDKVFSKVDPKLSVIIKNVCSAKFRNSSNCKSQFNKHFERMRIKAIFATQAGNIIVELYDNQDVKKVLQDWKPNFFNVESGIKSDTMAELMADSGKRLEIIIKKVNKNWSEEDIKAELESSNNVFTNPTVKRFIKRSGETLNTIKIDLKNHDEYLKATRQGVFLHQEHFNVEPYIPQARAHQCYKCKNFGHPAKWCTRTLRCQYCAEQGHSGKDCFLQGEVHQYRCTNCNGNHSATYSKCPVYLKNIRSTSTQQRNNYA